MSIQLEPSFRLYRGSLLSEPSQFLAEDPILWVEKFEMFCSLAGIPKNLRTDLAYHYLKGASLTWHRANLPFCDFEDWKQKFIYRFSPDPSHYFEKLKAINVGNFDSFETFVDEFKLLVSYYRKVSLALCNSLQTSDIRDFETSSGITLFFNSLDKETRKFCEDLRPYKLEDAIHLAIKFNRKCSSFLTCGDDKSFEWELQSKTENNRSQIKEKAQKDINPENKKGDFRPVNDSTYQRQASTIENKDQSPQLSQSISNSKNDVSPDKNASCGEEFEADQSQYEGSIASQQKGNTSNNFGGNSYSNNECFSKLNTKVDAPFEKSVASQGTDFTNHGASDEKPFNNHEKKPRKFRNKQKKNYSQEDRSNHKRNNSHENSCPGLGKSQSDRVTESPHNSTPGARNKQSRYSSFNTSELTNNKDNVNTDNSEKASLLSASQDLTPSGWDFPTEPNANTFEGLDWAD